MSTTDHPKHPNPVAPQCPITVPDPVSVLREAVAIIATLDHTSTAEATDQLLALAQDSGHHPLCVATEIAHLSDPNEHPHPRTHPGLGAVHQRWTPPLHQREHPPHQVPERVWAIVLAAAAPTRPTTTPPPPTPAGPTAGRTLKVAGWFR